MLDAILWTPRTLVYASVCPSQRMVFGLVVTINSDLWNSSGMLIRFIRDGYCRFKYPSVYPVSIYRHPGIMHNGPRAGM
jgi:hypothetical protein